MTPMSPRSPTLRRLLHTPVFDMPRLSEHSQSIKDFEREIAMKLWRVFFALLYDDESAHAQTDKAGHFL